jgi:flagellar motor switch protein FliN/FliY
MPDLVADLSPALDAAVAALAPLLPSENGLTPDGPPVVLDALAPALPGTGARILAARLGGLDGATLLVALAADVADILEQGPRGLLDLADVLRPALSAAVDAMGARLGPLAVDTVSVLGAGEAPPPGDLLVAGLVDGERRLVAVALVVPAGSLAGAAPVEPEPVVAAAPSGAAAPAAVAATATPVAFDPLVEGVATNGMARSLDLLHDVEMGVTAELGRTRLTVRNLLALVPGSVVELDRAAGTQVDLLVNGTLIARGEVVVIDDEFGVRISEVVGGTAGEVRR